MLLKPEKRGMHGEEFFLCTCLMAGLKMKSSTNSNDVVLWLTRAYDLRITFLQFIDTLENLWILTTNYKLVSDH